ncbi:L,D-transpeptidase family protein [Polycladidibacter hongkongensis]|uniref:L,D-transpeptidase family protein n=1 Tax=Polycladidibacter hongkongensis TaxID=1647556 RepID=UPI001AD92098|nr:murein L,D-transpeptidase family protein [Pseudovibrio hongkongensis]
MQAPRFLSAFMRWPLLKLMAILAALTFMVSCQSGFEGLDKADRPVSSALKRRMEKLDMAANAPIFIRIFKEESELEIWKKTRSGKYAKLETYEICKWSGKLGPKFKEGDRQAPEGFYEVTPGRMNPNSSYYLSFNLGFPNKYDRAHGRTGSHLMVHGACSSRGCYAMTDEQIADIYALGRDAFFGGQRKFQVQAFPFHMTAQNMARHRHNKHYKFWQMLKEGSDHFEITKTPPKVEVCEGRYVFNAKPAGSRIKFDANGKCPAYTTPDYLSKGLSKRQAKDKLAIADHIEKARRKAERDAAIARLFGSEDKLETPLPTNTKAQEKVQAKPSSQQTQVELTRGGSMANAPTTKPQEDSQPKQPNLLENSADAAIGFFNSIFARREQPQDATPVVLEAPKQAKVQVAKTLQLPGANAPRPQRKP